VSLSALGSTAYGANAVVVVALVTLPALGCSAYGADAAIEIVRRLIV